MTFAALATVVDYPIRLVHPIVNVQTNSGFSFNSQIFNSLLLPIRGSGSTTDS